MKNSLAIVSNPESTAVPQTSEKEVLQAVRDAAEAEENYVLAAIIAGCALLEFRDFLGKSSFTGRVAHSGLPSINGRNQHSEGEGWYAWLERNGLARQTAERWMGAAKAVAMKCLGLDAADVFEPFIDVGGEVIPLSHALVGPDAELPKQALGFRQSLFDFIANKTLAAAVRAALEGDSPASRILRAANGQDGGTNGEDRKDFLTFGFRGVKNFLSHLGAKCGKRGGHWGALNKKQQAEACQLWGLAMQGLPQELLEFSRDAAAEELKRRKGGGQPEPLALKAALQAKVKNALRKPVGPEDAE